MIPKRAQMVSNVSKKLPKVVFGCLEAVHKGGGFALCFVSPVGGFMNTLSLGATSCSHGKLMFF